MKHVNNNEVDLLLRSLARERGNPRLQSELGLEDSNDSEHLDADELNSYAEGVVPAPARARYLEHLADCEACRSIVVDLSQSAGAVARYEVPQPQGGSNFWQKLAALFSPIVLRFAVPALVLAAVIGIGFVALWQQRRTEFVALRSNQDSHRVATEPPNDSKPANPSMSVAPSSNSGATQLDPDSQTRAEKNLQEKKPLVAADAPAVETAIAKAPARKDSAQPGEDAGVAAGQVYAPEPKAAAQPPPPTDLLEADKSAELAKERPAKREEAERRDAFRLQTDEEHGPSRSRNNTAAIPATGRGTDSLRGGRGPSEPDKKKASAVETRSISGRRFIRADNIWVDNDYDPSRATIKVKRGSEQFRVLAADEPGIRAIADQLGGVVIVVWKNRAYRIQ